MAIGKAGYPDYSKAGGSKFISELWECRVIAKVYDLLQKYNPKLCTDYEGDIQKVGDLVLFRRHRRIFEAPGAIFKVCVDKEIRIVVKSKQFPFEYAQSDLNLMNQYTDDMAREIFSKFKSAHRPVEALFASRVSIEESADLNILLIRFLYGYKIMDPFCLATEIIREFGGSPVERIIEEMERVGL